MNKPQVQIKDLYKFCDPVPCRYDLSTPFNIQGKTVATDGFMIVICESALEPVPLPETAGPRPKVDPYLERIKSLTPGNMVELPTINKPENVDDFWELDLTGFCLEHEAYGDIPIDDVSCFHETAHGSMFFLGFKISNRRLWALSTLPNVKAKSVDSPISDSGMLAFLFDGGAAFYLTR